MEQAFPLCRSITGNGVRQTLDLIGTSLTSQNLERYEIPSGTQVLDWTVPDEWNLKSASLHGPTGVVLNSGDNNLHVVSYSVAVDQTMSLEQLRPHLHSLPELPEAIPYRTSYYNRTWGLCMTDRSLRALPEGQYKVKIESTLKPGHLSYGEVVLPGYSTEEILLSTHICHPSMANDNLSGIAVLVTVLNALSAESQKRHYTIRALFIPGTIGSITWLARNRQAVNRIKAGLVLAGVGNRAAPTYKRSRKATSRIDLVMERLVAAKGGNIIDYYPYGYDERQFCSPGFDLPVGRLSRSLHGSYPEYHSSLDTLEFVSDEILGESAELVISAIQALETEPRFLSLMPYGEPQLGRRGLYGKIGGAVDSKSLEMSLLWMLAYSDGERSLFDIARISQLEPTSLQSAATVLLEAGLLEATN